MKPYVLIVLCLCLLPCAALGLDLPETRKELPELEAPVKPGLKVPALPPPPKAGLSSVPFVEVRRFIFDGNAEIRDAELEKIAAPYTGRKISSRDLLELRYKLTTYYIQKGYINSGALLPDQKVTDGTIRYQIIEGRLTRIDVAGVEKTKNTFILDRIQREQGKVLNINRLTQTLQLLQQDPLVDKVNGELTPGLGLGEAVLALAVTEADPVDMRLTFGNHRPPSTGAMGGEVALTHHNLSGRGDKLDVKYRYTEGSDDVSLSYGLLLHVSGTRLSGFYDYTDSGIIEEPFDLIDIKSTSRTLGLSLSQPLIHTPDQTLTLTLNGEKRTTDTFLYGNRYSFDANADNGEINITVARLSLDWQRIWPSQVLALRSVLSQGIDGLDATDMAAGAQNDFLVWLGQAQLASRLNLVQGDQLILRANVQLAADPLPAMEKFAVGGVSSVRGYRENQLVRDNGLTATVEYRIPLFRMPWKVVSRSLDDGLVQAAPFADWGRSWNSEGYNDTEIISSVGVGLRWDPSPRLHARIYYGHAFQHRGNADHNLQDDGIHFLIKWDFY